MPRTTLQGWIARVQHIGLEPEVVAFFESPAGVRFLHRLFQALLLVVTLVSADGLRHLAMVLRLSGLDRWIASSHGALHAASVRLETLVGSFGDEQRAKLAPAMPPRKIALCVDETHHPAPSLVALEPDSDFLLVEQYAARRDVQTFVASSMCVEGRNGHLRRYLHGLHRLPPRKLKALTVVHNFLITRPDGTTAAERFFGAPHDDLFEALCARLPPPARPRPRRVRSAEPTDAVE